MRHSARAGTATMLMLFGVVVGVGAILGLALAPAAQAGPRGQERPTLLPERPTVPSGTDDGDDTSDEDGAPTAELGRITGTVIDLTTSAPASGIAVRVGEQSVISDANGNYDRNNLEPGSYTVSLELAIGQGEPAQGPILLELEEGATAVQHLAFRSRSLAIVTPESPPAPPGTSSPPAPSALPNTGGENGGLLLFALVVWACLALLVGAAIRQLKP